MTGTWFGAVARIAKQRRQIHWARVQASALVDLDIYKPRARNSMVNGVPACANKFLLTDVLRGEWGFNGYVISDEGAIEDIMDNHKYAKTEAEVAAAAVNAGCNLEDGPGYKKEYFFAITDAVQQKLLDEATVREAVKPLFYTRMRLGLFDPPSMVPYSRLAPEDVVQSAEHRNLSLSLALNSFVLLKNSAQFLPLKAGTTVDKVAILGPMADNVGGIFGEYAPSPDPKYITTPLKGLQKLGATSSYAAGCSDLHCGQYSEAAVKTVVTGASLIVVCLGTGADVESESNDRADIALPGKQLQLLQDAARYGEGAPVVLLLFNAGPLDVRWALASPRVPAIVACFFPAQATGDALYRMFFNEGRHGNPAGRLPATWPQSLDQVPNMTDYSMVNRTYRYIEYEPLFPFGYGLSYTTFQYRELSIRPRVVKYDEVIKVDMFVTNIGPYDGDEVVQLYVSCLNSSEQTAAAAVFPRRQLVGFRRVFVPRGEGRQVALRVRPDQLAVWDDNKGFVVLPGTYTLYAGGQQPGQKVNVGSNILEQQFRIST